MAVARKNNNVNRGRILPDLSNEIPGNPTKETVRSVKATDSLTFDPIARHLKEVADPYFNALNNPGRNGFAEGEAGDSGHTSPAMQEKNFKFYLIHNLNYLNRQLNGPIFIDEKDSDGNATGKRRMIPSMKERLEQSEKIVYADNFDPQTEASVKALYWLEVNMEQFNWLTAMFNSFAAAYREIYREDWKPNAPTPKVLDEKMGAAPAKEISDAIMKRREALKARAAA